MKIITKNTVCPNILSKNLDFKNFLHLILTKHHHWRCLIIKTYVFMVFLSSVSCLSSSLVPRLVTKRHLGTCVLIHPAPPPHPLTSKLAAGCTMGRAWCVLPVPSGSEWNGPSGKTFHWRERIAHHRTITLPLTPKRTFPPFLAHLMKGLARRSMVLTQNVGWTMYMCLRFFLSLRQTKKQKGKMTINRRKRERKSTRRGGKVDTLNS